MARTEIYEHILDQLANGELSDIETKVYAALRRVFPAGTLTRYDLIEAVYGYRPGADENLNNNTDDRKIRTAIASMFDKGIPVVSHSGGAGYRIDIDLDAWSVVIEELSGRKNSLDIRLESAYRIVANIKVAGRNAIPTDVPQSPKQLSLLEMN